MTNFSKGLANVGLTCVNNFCACSGANANWDTTNSICV